MSNSTSLKGTELIENPNIAKVDLNRVRSQIEGIIKNETNLEVALDRAMEQMSVPERRIASRDQIIEALIVELGGTSENAKAILETLDNATANTQFEA